MPGPLFGMASIPTETSAILTGGFDKPYWGLDKEESPWIHFYNKYRAQSSIHELKCKRRLGCNWTNWDWSLETARGYHVSFFMNASNDHKCLTK